MNCNTIAELLARIVDNDIPNMDKYADLNHPPTIGDMYEGLTDRILQTAIPERLGLQIVSGFIRNAEGKTSRQIDRMVVAGDMEYITNTETVIARPEQVIAVIEVKKNLNLKELKDSYENMLSVVEVTYRIDYSDRHLRDAFESITGKRFQHEIKDADMDTAMILNALASDSVMPVRIVLGYDGYKTERGFREAFIDYIESNLDTGKSGIRALPSMIISGKYSFIKSNGMPFFSPLDSEGFWEVYGSTDTNPLYYLLELIFDKISYKFSIDFGFLDELKLDSLHRFIRCKHEQIGDRHGWNFSYSDFSSSRLKEEPIKKEYSPPSVEECAQEIVFGIMNGMEIDLVEDRDYLQTIAQKFTISIEDLIEKSLASGIVVIEKGKLVTNATSGSVMMISPDGKIYAADTRNSRITPWFLDQMNKKE